AAVQVDQIVAAPDHCLEQVVGQRLAEGAVRIAGKDTVGVLVVGGADERRALPEGRQVDHRHADDTPAQRGGVERAAELHHRVDGRVFGAVDAGDHAEGGTVQGATDGKVGPLVAGQGA